VPASDDDDGSADPASDDDTSAESASDSDDAVEMADDGLEHALDALDSSVDQALPPYIAPPDGQPAGANGDAVEPPAKADLPGDPSDDLRQIKGIGPSIEKTLHELGFRRYRQIAEMTEYDIDRVARQLKGFRSRIYREDWIGQARMLQQQKNSNPS
jgi:NADH-quinone oxidoreductase subunit E